VVPLVVTIVTGARSSPVKSIHRSPWRQSITGRVMGPE
jgi:hypothetical protein